MRVGLLLKRDKPEAIELGRELARWLVARGDEAIIARNGDANGAESGGGRVVDERELAGHIDLLAVLGGDGTLLHASELVTDGGVPLLGINLGNLGFLTTSQPEHSQRVLELALTGKLRLERRMRLRIVLERASGERDQPVVRYACNDAVISQGALARLLEFEALLDGSPITTYRADGLIIATPTGSTAYNLAAGGPILAPDVQAMIISPICPHTLTNRPVVVTASSRVRVRLGAGAANVVLTIDGQWATAFGDGDSVEIHAANRPLLLYRSPDLEYFDVLRAKLHWGERSRSGAT